MRVRSVILDAGPLAAMLRQRDQHPRWASAQVVNIPAPMLTCEAVLSEAHFLLQNVPTMRQEIAAMSEVGIVLVAFSYEEEKASIRKLLEKYADVPMSFADACLVRMSDIYPDSAIFTLDSDFKIYRRNGRQPIPLIYPEQ